MPFLRSDHSSWSFSARATFAAMVAFGIALALHLPTVQWAPITVWIVAQPSRGKTLSKGFYRLLGTSVGAIGAVLLMVSCRQTPWVFLAILSVWVGLTTYAANLVQYFRSYGAVLAGYTTSIVAILVYSHPDEIRQFAEARIICIFLGISVAVITTSFLSNSRLKEELYEALRQTLAATCDWAARVILRDPRDELLRDEKDLVDRISALEELTNYAAVESMQIRRKKKSVHEVLAHLFATISSIRSLGLKFRVLPQLIAESAEQRQNLAEQFRKLAESLRTGVQREELPEISFGNFAAEEAVVQNRIKRMMFELRAALAYTFAVLQNSSESQGVSKSFYRDLRHARIVGLRTTVSVFIAGMTWILTGWSAGPLLVMMTAVNCGIFATSNDPQAGLMTSLKASLASMFAALAVLWILSVGPAQLWFLLLLMAIALIPGGLLVANSKYTTAGTLYGANFLLFLSPNFPMSPFDLGHFSSVAMGFFASIFMMFFFYQLIFPVNIRRRKLQMIEDISRDLERIARAPSKLRAFEWETLMYNRVGRFIKLLGEIGEIEPELLEGIFAAIDLGREIFRLRNEFDGPAKSAFTAFDQEVLREALVTLSSFSKDPSAAASELEKLSVQTTLQSSALKESLRDAAESLRRRPQFLQRSVGTVASSEN